MRASILDLRRNMREILKTLDRNESVTLTYHGNEKATIVPKKKAGRLDMRKHPAFGIWANRKDIADVNLTVRQIRKGRLNAL